MNNRFYVFEIRCVASVETLFFWYVSVELKQLSVKSQTFFYLNQNNTFQININIEADNNNKKGRGFALSLLKCILDCILDVFIIYYFGKKQITMQDA